MGICARGKAHWLVVSGVGHAYRVGWPIGAISKEGVAMRVCVGDVRLYFDVEGAQLTADGATMRERPTLLLLHGGPGFDHSIFKPAFSKFQDVFQIVYLD